MFAAAQGTHRDENTNVQIGRRVSCGERPLNAFSRRGNKVRRTENGWRSAAPQEEREGAGKNVEGNFEKGLAMRGSSRSSFSRSVLHTVGREMKERPPRILSSTRRKFGPARAEAQRKAILLSKARKAGANIPY